MNPYVKQLWLDALPHYTQTIGRLRDGNAFCVSGVLCDLHSKATGRAWRNLPVVNGGEQWDYLGETDLPPQEVLQWACVGEDDLLPLQDMNDIGVGWQELATYIAAL